MKGYDFDKTIHKGDSFTAFYFYTILKRPFLVLLFPVQVLVVLVHLTGLISKKKVKEFLMLNLKFFKNKQKLVDDYWNKRIKNIKQWYLQQKQDDDVIISASPYFLVKGACDRLGLKNVFGTDMNLQTGKINGRNCWGTEKVVVFEKAFGKELVLEEFYSDSLSDLPMMKKAKKGIFVKGDIREEVINK